MPKPTNIIAQVAGSGTALVTLRVPRTIASELLENSVNLPVDNVGVLNVPENNC